MRTATLLVALLLMISGLACIMAVPPVYGENKDPEKETPTDDTIEITIDNVDFSVTPAGLDKIKLKLVVKGTTSTTGNNTTHHIGSSLWTTYFKNGTIDGGDIEEYPADGIDYSDDEMTFRITSKKENWTEWEIYYEAKIKFTVDEEGNISADLPKIDKTKVFVRAYSDEEGNNWTQASKDITSDFKNAWKIILGDEEDDDDSPGFELSLVIGALGLISFGNSYRNRRRRKE